MAVPIDADDVPLGESASPGTLPLAVQVLVQACEDLDRVPASHISDHHAQEFFALYPLDTLFRILSSGHVTTRQLQLVQTVLSKLLATPSGIQLLPSTAPYLAAAAQAAEPPLRALAAQQYGRLLQYHSMPDAFTGLVKLLGDPDTSVASAAQHALTAAATASSGGLLELLDSATPAGSALQALSKSTSSVVRLRSLGLLVGLAGRAPGVAQLLSASGLLQPLQDELSNTNDPLSVLSALSLVQELADAHLATTSNPPSSPFHAHTATPTPQISNGSSNAEMSGDANTSGNRSSHAVMSSHASASSQSSAAAGTNSGAAAALSALVLPQIVQLVQRPGVLRSGAMPVAAQLLRVALVAGTPVGDVMDAEGPGAPPTAELLRAMAAVLDERGDEPAEAEVTTLDAVGALGLSKAGAELLLLGDPLLPSAVFERALGRAPTPDVRAAALHAAASIAGLERANEAETRTAALLSQPAEDVLRTALYAACGRRSPSEVLLPLLQQPFTTVRTAAYRLAASLALRAWFAAEVANSPALLEHLLSPGSETSSSGAHWRQSAVLSLHATANAAVIITSAPVAEVGGRETSASVSSSAASAGRGGSGGSGGAVVTDADQLRQHAATLGVVAGRVATAVAAGPFGANARGGGTASANGGGQHLVATLP